MTPERPNSRREFGNGELGQTGQRDLPQGKIHADVVKKLMLTTTYPHTCSTNTPVGQSSGRTGQKLTRCEQLGVCQRLKLCKNCPRLRVDLTKPERHNSGEFTS